jgi:prevent-host-death family protein
MSADPLYLTGQIDRSKYMKQIQASMAKARFAELLDDVAAGETVVITRHGQAIARIVPERQGREAEIKQAIADIKALRKHTKGATVEEILAWRDEGRR